MIHCISLARFNKLQIIIINIYHHNFRRKACICISGTYFKSDTSAPKKLMMLDVNMKLENTVNRPAITVNKTKLEEKKKYTKLLILN